jgi:hypothetical protein
MEAESRLANRLRAVEEVAFRWNSRCLTMSRLRRGSSRVRLLGVLRLLEEGRVGAAG